MTDYFEVNMNEIEFAKKVDFVKKLKPNWFLSEDKSVATPDEVERGGLLVNGRLPEEYIFFSLNYPAGYFAFMNIYSMVPGSEWYLIMKNKEYDSVVMPENFIAFSDDETGGYYGFIKQETRYSNEVYFWDSSSTENIISVKKNFFEFVINRAFQLEHFDINLP